MAKQEAKKLNNPAKTAGKAPVKEVRASARYLRISPRKARLVTDLLRGMHVIDALAQLDFVSKKGSSFVRDLLKSAIANAENNFSLKKENLYIKAITCDSGPKLKRYMPRAQGRASEIRRPLTHINIILEERANAKRARNFSLGTAKIKGAKPEKIDSAKTTKEELASEQNKQAMRNQIDKGEQETKRNTPTQKRRLFNRKSGV